MTALQLFIVLLQTVFITLKLTGHIVWPWLVVFLPLLTPIALSAIGFSLLWISKKLETEEQRNIREAHEALNAFIKRHGRKR